jgi:hypothetical protein
MTRNLRKRHFAMWLVISIVLLGLLIYARINIPVFDGDQPKIVNQK